MCICIFTYVYSYIYIYIYVVGAWDGGESSPHSGDGGASGDGGEPPPHSGGGDGLFHALLPFSGHDKANGEGVDVYI